MEMCEDEMKETTSIKSYSDDVKIEFEYHGNEINLSTQPVVMMILYF